jgi:hypothetical protein
MLDPPEQAVVYCLLGEWYGNLRCIDIKHIDGGHFMANGVTSRGASIRKAAAPALSRSPQEYYDYKPTAPATDGGVSFPLPLTRMMESYFSQKKGGEVGRRPVSASTPSLVMSSVCSNCADRRPSAVAAVHLSYIKTRGRED